MITGIHALLYSNDADATRAFFRDTLALRAVDAGQGWLVFALPPAELGIHPADDGALGAELYLLCDNLEVTVAQMTHAGAVLIDGPTDQPWGRLVTITIPGDVAVGLYQPRRTTAISTDHPR
jgi:predicted enzyme related to lactoylglutathione lyase